MLERDVANLVAQHAGERGLVLDEAERAPGDEDVTTGGGERVDLVGIEDAEVVADVRPLGLRGDRVADQRNVAGQRLVAQQLVTRAERRRDGAAELDFFRLVDVHGGAAHVGRIHTGDALGHGAEDSAGGHATTAAFTADEEQHEHEGEARERAVIHRAPPVFSPGSFRNASICAPSGWCVSTHVTMP